MGDKYELHVTGCFTIPTVLGKITRQEMLAEAESWLHTPYELGQHCKGAGVDCGTFIAEVLITCGLVPREDLGFYGHDWYCHETSDPGRYLRLLMKHAAKTMEGVAYASTRTEPGNVVLSKVVGSKHYNHGGIVVAWPRVIQAVFPKVNFADVTTDPLWCPQQIIIFDPWRKPS